MNAITVRNLPPGVAKAVKEKARKEKLSLNKAILRLLEEAITGAPGVARARNTVVHDDLDHLAGTWSAIDYRQFADTLREQRKVETELWK